MNFQLDRLTWTGTYDAIVKIVDLVDVEQASELGGDVRSVRRQEDDREATPKIDQHFAVVERADISEIVSGIF